MVCWFVLLTTGITVNAEATEDYKTFSQGDPRWSGYVYGGGRTIGNSGCFITAIAVLMAYANPDLRDVNTFNPEILAKKMNFAGAALYSDSCKNADETFTKVADDDSSKPMSESVLKEKIMGYLEKGCYVTVMATGSPITGRTHFSPIVGLDDEGNPLIWDVNGGKHTEWKDWVAGGITEIDVFQSTVSKSLEMFTGSDVLPTGEAIEEAKHYIVGESELLGGLKDIPLVENQIELVFASLDDLSLGEIGSVLEINNRDRARQSSIASILNAFVSFIGICLVVYSVVLFTVALFDCSNDMFDVNLVEILTFGRCRVHSSQIGGSSERFSVFGDFSLRQWRVRCAVLGMVGILLISGLIQHIILSVIFKI